MAAVGLAALLIGWLIFDLFAGVFTGIATVTMVELAPGPDMMRDCAVQL